MVKSFKGFLALLVTCHLSLVTGLMMPINSFAQQESPPPPAAPRPVNFPKPVEKTLANGLRVIFVERAGTSLATARLLLIKNGGEVDPPKLAGLADMTASLLTKGTTKRTAPQIAEAIEALGGMVDYGANWDASQVTVSVASSQIDPAMEILSDVVRRPTFKDDELERQRQQSIDQLSFMLADPGQLARYVASRVVFGDSPYGHPLNGTPESLALIKREDVAKLHSAYYRPDNAILVIGGDLRSEEAFKLAERYFGDWAKPSTPLNNNEPAISYRRASGQRVVVVDMEHAGQAAVILTRTGLKRTDPDFFRGIVTNSVLGGGYSARLNQEIRTKRGLSYDAGSALEVRRSAGPFIAVTQTKNESGAEVASLLMTELGRLASASIPDTELTPRKAALIGNYARHLETIEGMVGQVGSLALYGLSLDEINSYIRNVQNVQAAEIQKFAGARLDVKDADIIIVGRASDFLADLRKRFKNVEVIPEAELDLNSADLRKASGAAGGANGARMK